MTSEKRLPFICLLIALFIMTIIITGVPYAKGANAGGAALDEKGEAYSDKYWSAQPNDNVISLIRKQGLSQDQFVLRMTNPYVMNGCVSIGNYTYSAEYTDIYLDITIGNLTVDMRNQPRHSHFECNQKTQFPVADIILNRQDLKKNATQKIRMHNGNDINYYNISLSDHTLSLLADKTGSRIKRFKQQTLPGRRTALLYWFYPVGTIIMWVPAAGTNQDMSERLNAFAKSKNLRPMQALYPKFESPLTDAQYHYFVDTEGDFINNRLKSTKGVAVGYIFIDKVIYGLEGDKTELNEMAVYAKTPGLYE